MLDILTIIELDINYKVFNTLPYFEGSLSYSRISLYRKK